MCDTVLRASRPCRSRASSHRRSPGNILSESGGVPGLQILMCTINSDACHLDQPQDNWHPDLLVESRGSHSVKFAAVAKLTPQVGTPAPEGAVSLERAGMDVPGADGGPVGAADLQR